MYFLVEISRYEDAATVFVRWGQAADKCKAVQSQCKVRPLLSLCPRQLGLLFTAIPFVATRSIGTH
jgi:hypothetical protein